MSDALDFTVDALATFRITRLVVDDSIADDARNAALTVAEKVGGPEFRDEVAELLSCYWCSARKRLPSVWRPLAAVLALSAIAGLLGSNRYDADRDGD
jgi:hypothetical protein